MIDDSPISSEMSAMCQAFVCSVALMDLERICNNSGFAQATEACLVYCACKLLRRGRTCNPTPLQSIC
jgi:hypothetical protein